jgi:hypothetical protein
MRRAALALLVAACGGSRGAAPPPAAATSVPKSPAQIAELATASIVTIKTQEQLGTGFVVWADGRIATNLHVIAGAREATVTLNDGREFKDVRVLGADPARDLVVLRIDAEALKPLPLGDSHAVKPGERVVAIGHPLGLGNTVSDGIISAVRVIDKTLTLLQITAPIAPGSSGGPIFNEKGEVVGIATRAGIEGQNLNFGVPVAYLKPLLLAERAVPLASFTKQLDIGLLEGCSVDEVQLAAVEISGAIKIGVPLFNKGDAQGCYETYQKTSLKLVGELKACARVRETLLAGLSTANRAETAADKAWAIRHAFDRVMNAVTAALEQAEKQQTP